VQRNSPLEIVTNLHSKRKTEQMVLFDQGSRFYGADASSLLARKPQLTPAAMSVMLGRDHEHPTVQVLSERHYPITPTFNETRSGVCLTVDGQDFTPEELVAMVLSHAKDITAAYGTSQVKDCVLTVPSFYTQHERRALLDAASLADLNVLALINENTAAALHFGIDRIDEKPQHFIFYNMGASALQVSVVRYFSYQHKDSKYGKAKTVGAFEVIGTAWDSTLGGLAFDARLVEHMADEFNEMWNAKRNDGETKDVRKNQRAMTKLRLQANKVKHVLSANNDIPVYMDALHDDTSYQTHVSRAKFEEVCHDLLLRATEPITNALKAANKTLDDIDGVELIGGGMRVPKVQEEIQTLLGDKLDLGMHINSDESMALGAAFHGANVSTAFRVRHVGMADINPFPVSISLSNLPVEEKGGLGSLFGMGKKKEEGDSGEGSEEEEEEWSKHATIFKKNGKIGIKKTIAFTHDADVLCSIDYEESDSLPVGTDSAIERYNITGVAEFAKEMADKGLAKPKVTLQFELSTSGLTQLIKAEAAVEEIITVTEEVEVEEEEEEGDKTEEAAATEGEEKAGEEAKEEEKKEDADAKEGEEEKKEEAEGKEEEKKEKPKKKKKKTKTVEKEKKKVHKKPLKVKTYHVGHVKPHSASIMQESKNKLQYLAQKDKERMMLEEARNKVESYIYQIKNKLIDDEENIAKVSTEEQRSALSKMAEEAEDWMYDDGYTADLATMEDKYAELSTPAEKVWFRVAELTARPEALKALEKKMKKIEELMAKWETTMDHIPEADRADVLTKIGELRVSVAEKVKAQEEADPSEDPVLVSTDVPKFLDEVKTLVTKLSKIPKPKPVKEEKNDTKSEDEAKENATDADAAADGEKKEEEGNEKTSAEDDEADEGDDEL